MVLENSKILDNKSLYGKGAVSIYMGKIIKVNITEFSENNS